MTGVDPGVAQHHLNIPPDARPVKQRPRRQAPDRQRATHEEVTRLLAAGFIEEAKYPQWMSNVVLVKKHNGSWRMCVDYTSLNNACPKDCYLLPKIDQLVDAAAGHARLSFMDAYSGYNQIKMAPEDREHTAFLTDQGVYFYKVMSFRLKNAGATYQRTVNKMFAHQIGRNIEVYVDDMIVKSQEAGTHIADLTEAFATLRKFGMRLNPTKCAFGVTFGKFLGFIIHERGIDANPEKTCSDLTEGLLPCLTSSPGRAIAASPHAVSSVLIEESSGEQLPIYYVSHILSGPEGRYPPIEKLALALVLLAQKLRPYFQAHPVEVITDQPLRQVLSKFDVAGWLLKWVVELGEHDIRYVPRTAIKAQAVADFIAELTQVADGDLEQPPEAWILHVDGSASSKGAGAGLVLLAPDGRSFERSFRFGFKATNNEAEYEALLVGLRLALEMQVAAIHVLVDSQLVAEQLSGGHEARDPTMAKYLARVRDLTAKFPYFTLSNVPREENERADALTKLASKPTYAARPEVEELPARAIEVATTAPVSAPIIWVQELLRFKRDGTLPHDEVAARRLRRTHAWYNEESGQLYRRSFTYPLLRCLEPDEAQTVLAEIHEGICGEHSGRRTLAHKILRQVGVGPARTFPTGLGVAKVHHRGSGLFHEVGRGRAIGDNHRAINGEVRMEKPGDPVRTNGLAEVTNRSILDGLKRRVSAARSAWTDELPSVLWSLRTTPKTAIGESPYSLTFGTEAVLPPEVAISTLRTRSYDEEISNEGLRASLDMLEERRADAHLKALSYKRAVARVYNRKVRPRPIKLDDLVLRKTEVSDPTRARGKLAPKWEGPYRVAEVVRPGTYRLTTMDGSPLPRTWNVGNLKKFFV
ncbi:uncharacterized protein LOC135629242 [Musa acuminata AAA Group]|uniref:uncharacterized protein LOC135629242 n=1 Tax=Musa acuminata AAA Group TaxID=214697 RepID=UPI0031E0DA50